jgi:mannose-1-phosphate guanylyltransferase
VIHFAEEEVLQNKNLLVLIGQRARFANQNIGWIELGDFVRQVRGTKIFGYKRTIYRPNLEEAEQFLQNGMFAWNPGYFVTTPSFLLSQYKKFAPDIYTKLQQIEASMKQGTFQRTVDSLYPTLKKVSFDNLILEKVDPKYVLVIAADLGWSDVGAWEALKEALAISSDENVTRGKVLIEDSKDNLVFNYTDELVVGIDLEKMVIISTDDVLLVCHKNSIPKIKKLVESLSGTPNEHLT